MVGKYTNLVILLFEIPQNIKCRNTTYEHFFFGTTDENVK